VAVAVRGRVVTLTSIARTFWSDGAGRRHDTAAWTPPLRGAVQARYLASYTISPPTTVYFTFAFQSSVSGIM
jgi:hypothetical protein